MSFDYFFALPPDVPPGIGVEHFSPTHLGWLALVVVGCALVACAFWRASTRTRRQMLVCCAVALPVLEIARDLWLLAIGRFDFSYMLPLHLCGLMLLTEPFAVCSRQPIWKELSYCLGMPGAFFALLTPESTALPLLNLYYLQFIAVHALLLLLPVLLLIDGFRPQVRRLPACACALFVAICFDLLVNRLLNANYLFLHAAPPGSLLAVFSDFAGPYYLLPTITALFLFWVALYLPWPQNRLLLRFKML